MRSIQTLSKVFEFASVFLEKSILAWLGWQIAVEWSLDGAIQYYLSEFAKILYEQITGIPIKKGEFTSQELKELHEALDLYFKLLNGSGYIDGSDVKLAEWYNNASLKLRQMFDKLIKVINIKERMYNLIKEARLKKLEKEEIMSKIFSYLCEKDANSFVKMIDDLTSIYFDKFDNALKSFSLIETSQEYSNVMYSFYNKAKKFILDQNYLSLYERLQNRDLFNEGICHETRIITKPAKPIPPWGAIPECSIDIKVRAGISNEFIPRDLYITTISSSFGFTNYYDMGIYSYDAIYVMFSIKIFNIERGSDLTELYKLITGCTNIRNFIAILDAIDEYIVININSPEFINIAKYIQTDKLKLRKTKKCVSVIKKANKKRSKEQPTNFFLPGSGYYRRNMIITEYAILIRQKKGDNYELRSYDVFFFLISFLLSY
jgi:hypothetical protein